MKNILILTVLSFIMNHQLIAQNYLDSCSEWIEDKIEDEVYEYCELNAICDAFPSTYYYKVFETWSQIIFEKFSCQNGVIEFYSKNGDLQFTCDLSYNSYDEISPECTLNDYPFELNNTLLFGCNFEDNVNLPNIDVDAIGCPCDDGDPNTLNETIQSDCSCGIATNLKDELSELEFNLYPNPATDIINLDQINYQNVDLFDLNGKHMISFDTQSQTINISTLDIGTYILRVESEAGDILTKRLLKI